MRLPLLLFLLLDAAALVVFTVVAIVVLVVFIDITSTVVLLTCISSTISARHFCYRLRHFLYLDIAREGDLMRI